MKLKSCLQYLTGFLLGIAVVFTFKPEYDDHTKVEYVQKDCVMFPQMQVEF